MRDYSKNYREDEKPLLSSRAHAYDQVAILGKRLQPSAAQSILDQGGTVRVIFIGCTNKFLGAPNLTARVL